MKLRVKMWLVLGLVLLTVLALDLTTSWQKIHRDQRVEQEIDVQAMRALLMCSDLTDFAVLMAAGSLAYSKSYASVLSSITVFSASV